MPKRSQVTHQPFESAAEYRKRLGLAQLNIQVPEELAERARIAAVKKGMRLSEYLSTVLEDAIED
jgi:predicted HicB family RNase H-like nuclease